MGKMKTAGLLLLAAALLLPAGAAAIADGPQGTEIYFDRSWTYADESAINSGCAVLYRAGANSKGITVAVNAGHGTEGGWNYKTFCHPDHSAKVTGGSTAAGAYQATAVSGGMTFRDGTPEAQVTLQMAEILRDLLLQEGYDVLMLRSGSDVQLDNVARTVMANNTADCHIALHWDSDGSGADKGCFYCSVPEGLKTMVPVSALWQEHTRLGECLIGGLQGRGEKLFSGGHMDVDLTQTSYSTIPTADIELGNEYSAHDAEVLKNKAIGLLIGINSFFAP